LVGGQEEEEEEEEEEEDETLAVVDERLEMASCVPSCAYKHILTSRQQISR
jgi:hypothetical protein